MLLIVGGGVGGLACALGLAQQDRQVHVIESAPELAEIGAGIQLAPNATRVLAALGVLDTILERAVHPRELVYMDAVSGERITSIDLGAPFLARYGHPYIVTHRSDLHTALLEACVAHPAVSLETDRHADGIEDRGDSVHLTCVDGSSYDAEAVIGADGLRSFVRRWMVDDDLVETPHVAYRGAIPFGKVSPHAGQDSMVMWVGPDLHLVQYKLRGGELYNQVGVFRSSRYGEADDYGSPEELDEHFGACCEPVRYGASLLGRGVRWPMADRRPIDTWTQNRVTLLGDAAHPMLQYIAQGGCQAIEDSASMARSVAAHDGLPGAFLAYQDERVPRTARVQRTARRFGEACHLRGVAAELRNHVFSQRTPQDYDAVDWLYGPADGDPGDASVLTTANDPAQEAAR
jgi:salicylate hydroxylase